MNFFRISLSAFYPVIPVKLQSPSDTNFTDVATQQLNWVIQKKLPFSNETWIFTLASTH